MEKGKKDRLCLGRCKKHGPAPIPQEACYSQVTEMVQISGFSHGVGTCAPQQGACKLTLNVKAGVIQEALVEVIGCSGMTQSAAMACEILPGCTLVEAVNTDLACDAINVAMREVFLQFIYGRTQTAFSLNGLPIGTGIEDLGENQTSQVGTCYGSLEIGPRYLVLGDGYITRLALDGEKRIIGYEYCNVGKMMSAIDDGIPADDAMRQATYSYGRVDDVNTWIDPRKE